jgi:hypothetical protein
MIDWRSAMREAAERDDQDQLSAKEAQVMRRVVVAAVAEGARERAGSIWMRRPVLLAATIVAIISVGIATGVHLGLTNSQPPATPLASEVPIETTNTRNVNTPSRQLQFVTAGGTRIIWVFNSDLDLKATLR